MNSFLTLLHRETLGSWRQGGSASMVVIFYFMTVSLFPFGVGPDSGLLATIGGGIVWVAALLAAIVSLDRMFALDVEDGSMDLLVLTPMPLELLVATKALAHWLNNLGPVIVITPVLTLFFNLSGEGFITLMLTMVLGTPALSFIGAIGAALTASLKRGGVIIPLLVLPLYIPTLIFGAGAITEALNGSAVETSSLLYLAAISTFSIALGPVAAAAALRVTME